MKKILTMIISLMLCLAAIAAPATAAQDPNLAFTDTPWSDKNPYPEWYGGRYIDIETRRGMTYVVVEGYEETAAAILGDIPYVVKPYSYNELLITLDEITNRWMIPHSSDDPICLQSAGLDEINNCIYVELYTGSPKVPAMRDALIAYFGPRVCVTTTDSLIQFTTAHYIESGTPYQAWMIAAVFLLGIIALVVILRRTEDRQKIYVTAHGDTVLMKDSSNLIEQRLRAAMETPDPETLEKIKSKGSRV